MYYVRPWTLPSTHLSCGLRSQSRLFWGRGGGSLTNSCHQAIGNVQVGVGSPVAPSYDPTRPSHPPRSEGRAAVDWLPCGYLRNLSALIVLDFRSLRLQISHCTTLSQQAGALIWYPNHCANPLSGGH